MTTFPLTALIADAYSGNLTRADMQTRWREGKYRGVRPDLAKYYIDDAEKAGKLK